MKPSPQHNLKQIYRCLRQPAPSLYLYTTAPPNTAPPLIPVFLHCKYLFIRKGEKPTLPPRLSATLPLSLSGAPLGKNKNKSRPEALVFLYGFFCSLTKQQIQRDVSTSGPYSVGKYSLEISNHFLFRFQRIQPSRKSGRAVN